VALETIASMNPAHGKAIDRGNLSTRNRSISVALVLLLIGYGSLYPLTWNFETPQEFIILGSISLIDVVENIILFMPLGWLLACYHRGQPRRWLTFVAWFLVALTTASVLQ
jgi:glycopeptide antibiotics resistance protein